MSDHGHDDWFRHDSGEAPPQAEHAAHVNTTAIGLTLLAIVFGVLFTIILMSMYFVQYAGTRLSSEMEGVESAQPYIAYRDQSERSLAGFGWADQAAGTVNLPIDRAIGDVVETYGQPGVRASTPWVGPKPTSATASAAHPQAELAMQQEGSARDE